MHEEITDRGVAVRLAVQTYYLPRGWSLSRCCYHGVCLNDSLCHVYEMEIQRT